MGNLVKAQLKLADCIDECQSVVKKEKLEESKKSEQSSQLYNLLYSYCQKLKLRSSIDRNEMQAKQLSQKINLPTIFTEVSGSAKNVIRLIEKAIKSQKQLLTLEKDM